MSQVCHSTCLLEDSIWSTNENIYCKVKLDGVWSAGQEQAHTTSSGQNISTGISVPEDNVKDASDSSNQRGSYLNDLDWDRPPPYKMRILRPCCLIHSDSVTFK